MDNGPRPSTFIPTLKGTMMDNGPRPSQVFQQDVIALRVKLLKLACAFTRSHADAEDLVQETLLKALSNEHRFERGTNLQAWLFTILRNLFLTSIKKRKRQVVQEDFDLVTRSDPDQEWVLLLKETQTAIEALGRTKREALMHIAAGETYEEAAVACGCEVGTVKSRTSRARSELIAAIGNVVI
jgi:RNA polymerase sigma-70 factor, ECF subfamily